MARMKVFQIEYDYRDPGDDKVVRERRFVTGCWRSVTEGSIKEAEEYDKELISITDLLEVTQKFEP